MPKAYRIVPLGPSGAGKSQLCNFIYMDKSNMKFEVSDGLDSQTKYPQCEYCVRKINDENINIELIDTAGCSDSGGSDEENFKYLIDELKKKKSIDLFLLVFNFTNRIDGKTKDYKLYVKVQYVNLADASQVIVGTKSKEVKKIMGSPDVIKKDKATKTEEWLYTNNVRIMIENGKVANIVDLKDKK